MRDRAASAADPWSLRWVESIYAAVTREVRWRARRADEDDLVQDSIADTLASARASTLETARAYAIRAAIGRCALAHRHKAARPLGTMELDALPSAAVAPVEREHDHAAQVSQLERVPAKTRIGLTSRQTLILGAVARGNLSVSELCHALHTTPSNLMRDARRIGEKLREVIG